MFTIKNLKFTKFFDVKSPVGLEQKGETLGNYSIGMDLFMPKNTKEFRNAIYESNKKLYGDLYILKDESKESIYYEFKSYCTDILIMQISENKKTKEVVYQISESIQIPTGIGMLIPENVWAEVRSKSSNFSLGFSEVHGTIDMNYTYGCGVQLIPITNSSILLKEDQKLTQIVFHEAVPILKTEEISLNDWNNLDEVINKRGTRTGGFGSTGKM